MNALQLCATQTPHVTTRLVHFIVNARKISLGMVMTVQVPTSYTFSHILNSAILFCWNIVIICFFVL